MRTNRSRRRRLGSSSRQRLCIIESLESRTLLAAGIIELGPSDNIALDQPRVAIELATDVDPGPGVQWESIGPDLFNTFLLDTGASGVLAMASAVADMRDSPHGYDLQGVMLEQGVAGDHLLDVSTPYRFDFAGSDGIRHTLLDAQLMSDDSNDFSSFGPWGLAGMPTMVDRVTSLDFSGWSGGGLTLDSIYMTTEFRDDVPPDNGHRYTVSLDNRLSFDPVDQMISGTPPIWGDVPFATGVPEHNGIAQAGNFLFDTGAQISVISERLAIEIGLDSNGDGTLDQNDQNYVTQQVVGGVGGQIGVPVFGFDEFHLATDSGEDLVWTDLQWLVLDIGLPGEGGESLDGVLGSDLLTSGWFHAFFSPGQPDGYINQMHMDFREMETSGTGKIHFDLNPDVDNVILPGPGIIVRQSFRTTDVGEGGSTDSYNIVLTGAPTSDVTITLASPDGQAIAVSELDGTDTLVFTPSNWETVQTVTVTAVDDVAAEGNHTGLITHTVTSADPGYDGRVVQNVTVRITDDDLNLLEITSDQAGLNPISSIDATEGGATLSYWVALSEAPTADIWVQFEDSTGQATAVKTGNPPFGFENILEFSGGNWNTPQEIELTAVNDTLQEGPHVASMVHTVLDITNPIFEDLIVGQSPLIVNITDDDLGEVAITPSDTTTDISESGTTDTYEIALNMAPVGTVEITVQADAQMLVSADGGSNFASSQVLSFSDTSSQTITIQAIDDAVVEDTHTGLITHSVTGVVNDTRFSAGLPIGSLLATITDNDAAGLIVSTDPPGTGERPAPGANSETTIELVEAGAPTTYWVKLNSQPQADVTVFLSNSDDQATAFDANAPDNAFVTFNSLNWDAPQAVTAVASDDAMLEGIHPSQFSLNTFSADSNYQGSVVVPVIIVDDDKAEFGDAPAPYPTAIANNGANHVAVGPRLGANRDIEIDGIPSAGADGDDANDSVNDEDGVMFGTIKVANGMAGVNIDLQNASDARIDAWLDFDGNGVWDAADQILDNVPVVSGLQTLNFAIPAAAVAGDTYARVRLSTAGDLDQTGSAADGEVEDYRVSIFTAETPTIENIQVNGGSSQRNMLTEVIVTFDMEVTAPDSAFAIKERESGTVLDSLIVNTSPVGGKTVSVLTFAHPGNLVVERDNGIHSLIDGNYQLDLDPSQITPVGGGLNLAGDVTFGDVEADAFFRFLGDNDGDRDTDVTDLGQLGLTFRSNSAMPNFNPNFDFDGDLDVDVADLGQFGQRFRDRMDF